MKPHDKRCETCKHKDNYDQCEIINEHLKWYDMNLIEKIGCASHDHKQT